MPEGMTRRRENYRCGCGDINQSFHCRNVFNQIHGFADHRLSGCRRPCSAGFPSVLKKARAASNGDILEFGQLRRIAVQLGGWVVVGDQASPASRPECRRNIVLRGFGVRKDVVVECSYVFESPFPAIVK